MDRLLFLCFFLSGLAGLVYQVVWLRWLILLFGATTLAISTILTAFMGGLALGSWVAGRVAHRINRPFMAYGLLELGIGTVALGLPGLLSLSTPLFTWLTAAAGSYTVLSLGRFVLVTAVLLVPTACMGATLPLLAQHIARRWEALGWNVGALYAVNTLGAVAGTAAAGFLLLPTIGVWRTNLLAVGVNMAVGLTAAILGRRITADPTLPEATSPQSTASGPLPRSTGRLLLIAIAGSGVAAMVYEVAWSRALALVLGSSVYAFTVMLTTFLVGLALGSFFMARRVDRVEDKGLTLALVQLYLAAASFVGIVLVQELPYLFLSLFRSAGGAYGWLIAGKFVIAGMILFVPTLLMGAVFPLVVRMVTASLQRVGQSVGTVYAMNTVGAIIGSFAGGFLLIPWIGIRNSLLVAVTVNLVLAAGLLIALPSRRRRLNLLLAGLVPLLALAFIQLAPLWSPLVMSSGVAIYAPQYRSLSRQQFLAEITRGITPRYYREGLSTTVTVWEARQEVFLRVNGKTDASSSGDMPTQVLSGHFPLLLAKDPKDVLVIGLGSGVTAGAVTRYPVKHLTVVELEAAVVEASRFFNHVNHRPLEDPRTRVVLNDGRNFLLTTRERYDVIISEPSNPWMTGASSLFTQDFFQLGRARLREGGLFCQWLQLYGMDPVMLRTAIRTFQAVFPHVLIFQTVSSDLLLLGSERPLLLDLPRLQAQLSVPAVGEDLRRVGIGGPDDLLAKLLLGTQEVQALSTGAFINTDDNALIEFAAPRTLYANTIDANIRQLADRFRGLNGYVRPDFSATDTVRLAERYLTQGRSAHVLALARQVLSREESAEAHRLIAEVLIKDHQESEGIAHLQRALGLEPTHLQSLLTLARYHVDREAFEEALAVARKALAAHAGSASAAYFVGVSQYGLGAYREAWAALQSVNGRDAQALPRLPLYLGLAQWRLGQAKAARATLSPYVAAYPNDPLARYALGVIEYERGALDEATEHWTQGVAQRSREANALLAHAHLHAGRGELDLALEHLREAVKLDPLSVPIREEMAGLLERQGKIDDAIRAWEAVLERFPTARTAHLRLAELWQKTGNREKAREQLTRYLEGETDARRARAIARQLDTLR